jgi:hypothetical protein
LRCTRTCGLRRRLNCGNAWNSVAASTLLPGRESQTIAFCFLWTLFSHTVV